MRKMTLVLKFIQSLLKRNCEQKWKTIDSIRGKRNIEFEILSNQRTSKPLLQFNPFNVNEPSNALNFEGELSFSHWLIFYIHYPHSTYMYTYGMPHEQQKIPTLKFSMGIRYNLIHSHNISNEFKVQMQYQNQKFWFRMNHLNSFRSQILKNLTTSGKHYLRFYFMESNKLEIFVWILEQCCASISSWIENGSDLSSISTNSSKCRESIWNTFEHFMAHFAETINDLLRETVFIF